MQNYQAIIELDLLKEVLGVGRYENAVRHSLEIELYGRKCRVLDVDSLINAKNEMKRPKDKGTVIQLKAIKDKLGRN